MLELRGPIGRWFVWDPRTPALCVAGGSGVVPAVAMTRTARRARPGRPAHGGGGRPQPRRRCPTSRSCGSAGATLAFTRHEDGDRPAGPPTARRARCRCSAGAELAYVCGSPRFAEYAVPLLLDVGVDPDSDPGRAVRRHRLSSGGPAAVRRRGGDVRDDEDADAPGEGDPDARPTGCWANRSRIVSTIDVTGWFSAKARTGPGIVAVGTNAELTNGRKMIGYYEVSPSRRTRPRSSMSSATRRSPICPARPTSSTSSAARTSSLQSRARRSKWARARSGCSSACTPTRRRRSPPPRASMSFPTAA